MIVPIADEFAVADVVSPGLNAASRADLFEAGEGALGGVGGGRPLTVEAIGEAGLAVPPVVLLDDREILVLALERVRVA